MLTANCQAAARSCTLPNPSFYSARMRRVTPCHGMRTRRSALPERRFFRQLLKPRGAPSALCRVAVLLLQVLGEHAMRIDLDEPRRTARQHLSFSIANLGGPVMFAAVDAHLPAFDNERFEQRHRLQVGDFHLARQGNQIVQLVHLAHGFVEDGGDDASVGMGWRPDEAPLQAKAADEALALLVENKLQSESGCVGGTATEAIVGVLLFLYLVTVNFSVPGHVHKMKQSRSGCKWEDAFRHSLRRWHGVATDCLAKSEKRRAKCGKRRAKSEQRRAASRQLFLPRDQLGNRLVLGCLKIVQYS